MIAATEAYMKLRLAVALVLGFGMTIVTAAVDPTTDPVNVHLAAAQRAAGLDFPGLLARVCIVPPGGGDAAAGRRRAGGVNGLIAPAAAPAPQQERVPPRSDWYQEPRQVFDNFYWVGNNSRNSWVLKTSAGLIVIDTLFHYSVQPEIVEGITKLGMNPKDIKYVLISHGHGDHDEGAKILQDLGAHIIMSKADWDLMLGGTPLPGGNPKQDMIATDGQKLTLGDTTLTMYITPGH